MSHGELMVYLSQFDSKPVRTIADLKKKFNEKATYQN